MYQTVGHDVIDAYSEALGLPLYRRVIRGRSVNVQEDYHVVAEDEVEDLYQLLKQIKVVISLQLRILVYSIE